MTTTEKDVYIFIGFLILVLFASIGLLCVSIYTFNICKRTYYKKEIKCILNNSENINPII